MYSLRNITKGQWVEIKVSPEKSIMLKPNKSASLSSEEYNYAFQEIRDFENRHMLIEEVL